MAHAGKFIALAALLIACEKEVERETTAAREGEVEPREDREEGLGGLTEKQEVATFDSMFVDHLAAHLNFGVRLAEVGGDKAEHPELKTHAENLETQYKANVDQLKNWRNTWFGSGDIPSVEKAPLVPGVAGYTPGEWWKDDVKVGAGDTVLGTEPARTTDGVATADRTGEAGRVGMDEKDKGLVSGGAGLAWDPDDVVQALRNTDEPFDREFIDAMAEHHRHTIEVARAAEARGERPEVKDLAKKVLDAEQNTLSQLEKWRGQWYAEDVKEKMPAERMHVQP